MSYTAYNSCQSPTSGELRGVHRTLSYAGRRLPSRGTATDVPSWWMEDLLAVMADRRLQQVDLVAMLQRRGVSRAALKSQMSRFMTTDPEQQVRTAELAEAITDVLSKTRKEGEKELLPFFFRATSREVARAMQSAQVNPESLQRDLAAGRLMNKVSSGGVTLEALLQSSDGDHSPPIESADESRDLAGRRRRAVARPKTAPRRTP